MASNIQARATLCCHKVALDKSYWEVKGRVFMNWGMDHFGDPGWGQGVKNKGGIAEFMGHEKGRGVYEGEQIMGTGGLEV